MNFKRIQITFLTTGYVLKNSVGISKNIGRILKKYRLYFKRMQGVYKRIQAVSQKNTG